MLSFSAISDITYSLEVTAISPEYGSLLGGTELTITGEGFSNDPDVNSVKLGGVVCDIMSCSDTEIVCTTGKPTQTYEVSNMGIHPGTINMICTVHVINIGL